MQLYRRQRAFFNGTVTVTERVKYFIQNVGRKKHLNAFVKVYKEEALERTELIDQKIRNNSAGSLAGVVVALKDNIAWKEHPLSAASNILDGYIPTYNTTLVERLLAEDAIILGHLNCDEFAMGSANEISRYGLVTYASTLDQIGPLTSSPKDMLRIMEVISGPDGKDHTFESPPEFDEKEPVKTIGYFRESLDYTGLDPEIRSCFFSLFDNL